MSSINDNQMHVWTNGEDITQAILEQNRKVFEAAINDNWGRIIKNYQVLNADGTTKTTQSLTTALNTINFKDSANITISLDNTTSTLTFTVAPGSITSDKLDPSTYQNIAGTGSNILAPNSYSWVATAGQTTFTLPAGQTYIPSFLWVNVGGVDQTKNTITATNGTSFTVSEPLDAGTNVDARWFQGDVSTQAHHITHYANGVDPIDITQLQNYSLVAQKSDVGSRTDVYEHLLADTTMDTVATYTPTAQKNYMIGVYLRVVTAATNVTCQVTYADATGAQTNQFFPLTSVAVGSGEPIMVFVNAVAGTPINVQVQAGTVNQVYVSTSIVEV